jgi:enoyl-CoA hydratase/carnithine racemase
VTLQDIELDVNGPVATITLNRPAKLNALSPNMRSELDTVLNDLKAGDAVRVIRIRGAGRGFCSGYDLTSGSSVYASQPEHDESSSCAPGDPQTVFDSGKRMSELGESSIALDRERLRESLEQWLAIWNYRKPIVAQVHGVCLGGGLDLIGVCDIVYAAEDATFGHPASRGLGIPPTLGMLPVKIGAAKTKELFFTGDLIDAAEAHRLGLINEVVATADLDSRTEQLCKRIALLPLDALTLHKHVINRWSEIMGLRLAVLEGAEFNSMFHLSPASIAFGQIASSEGIRSALEWRDSGFTAQS